jgi:hypothetical protein
VEVEVEAAEGAEAKEVEGAGGRFTAKVEVKVEAEETLEGAGAGLKGAEETLEGARAGLEGAEGILEEIEVGLR